MILSVRNSLETLSFRVGTLWNSVFTSRSSLLHPVLLIAILALTAEFGAAAIDALLGLVAQSSAPALNNWLKSYTSNSYAREEVQLWIHLGLQIILIAAIIKHLLWLFKGLKKTNAERKSDINSLVLNIEYDRSKATRYETTSKYKNYLRRVLGNYAADKETRLWLLYSGDQSRAIAITLASKYHCRQPSELVEVVDPISVSSFYHGLERIIAQTSGTVRVDLNDCTPAAKYGFCLAANDEVIYLPTEDLEPEATGNHPYWRPSKQINKDDIKVNLQEVLQALQDTRNITIFILFVLMLGIIVELVAKVFGLEEVWPTFCAAVLMIPLSWTVLRHFKLAVSSWQWWGLAVGFIIILAALFHFPRDSSSTLLDPPYYAWFAILAVVIVLFVEYYHGKAWNTGFSELDTSAVMQKNGLLSKCKLKALQRTAYEAWKEENKVCCKSQ